MNTSNEQMTIDIHQHVEWPRILAVAVYNHKLKRLENHTVDWGLFGSQFIRVDNTYYNLSCVVVYTIEQRVLQLYF
ncbi:hypothetical protein GCM10027577_29640 [Spirosoma fluminis]